LSKNTATINATVGDEKNIVLRKSLNWKKKKKKKEIRMIYFKKRTTPVNPWQGNKKFTTPAFL